LAHDTSRRRFLQLSAALAASAWIQSCSSTRKHRKFQPGDKLDLGVIGVGNRGAEDLQAVSGENIVALCDVDRNFLLAASKLHSGAHLYSDFRDMLLLEKLDAVVVATPDHTHAVATAAALRAGLDVYCEKPLTHSVAEARRIAELARKMGAVTQMGIQIHAQENYHRAVEIVRAGSIGPVREVHVFCNGKSWSGGDRPTDRPPVPVTLRWDVWLGPAPERPYHPSYLPANWRRWWDFGGGTLSDMACHYMDLAFWALELAHPTSIEAEGPPVNPETTPPGLNVHYEFPARGEQPPCKLSWYDGGSKPSVLATIGFADWENGVLFIGDRGHLIADYDRWKIGPADRFASFTPPAPTIPASIGHHREWIEACKERGPTTCDFEYSGALTESVLLGNVAYRTGKRLEWDAEKLAATNAPEAKRFIDPPYRSGWSL
jgi:predicted dehydrogenase